MRCIQAEILNRWSDICCTTSLQKRNLHLVSSIRDMATAGVLRLVRASSSNILLNQLKSEKQLLRHETIRYISSSSFVSQGLVSKNVKDVGRSRSKSSPEQKFAEIKSSETEVVIQHPEDVKKNSPLVLLYGWGGASHKNLSKYADIYLQVNDLTRIWD